MSERFKSVRRHDANGIPELPEFIEELDSYFVGLALVPKSRMIEPQRAVSAVYSAMGGIGCNGLHCFWDNSPTYIREVKRGLKVVGAADVLGILKESEWAASIVRKGTNTHGHYQFTPDEELRLDIIEDRLYHSFVGLPTRLHQFCIDHGLYE